MPSPLPTVSLRLADLMSDPYLFAVPPYQRGYSWTEKEAGQLLDDVVAASGIDAGETAEPDYFLGVILLLGGPAGIAPEADAAPRGADIVDGQQRLVTIAIFASALRDLDEGGAMSNEVAPLLTTKLQLPPGRPTSYRIELRGQSQRFLETCVLSDGACGEMPERSALGEAERRILDVREHFIEELGQFDADQRLALIRYIKHACYFVVMSTPDIDRAHRMFMVLNARGKPLNRYEILKAEVLNQVVGEAAARALEIWDGAARSLDGERFEAFFSHLRTIYGEHRPQVIGGVRVIIQSCGGAEAFVETVLAPMVDAYRGVVSPGTIAASGAAGDSIRRSLRYLHRLNGSEWMPAAMVALRRLPEDPAGIAREIEAIERWAHVLRLLCLGGPKRVRRFAGVIEAVRLGRSLTGTGSPCQLTRDERKAIAYNFARSARPQSAAVQADAAQAQRRARRPVRRRRTQRLHRGAHPAAAGRRGKPLARAVSRSAGAGGRGSELG